MPHQGRARSKSQSLGNEVNNVFWQCAIIHGISTPNTNIVPRTDEKKQEVILQTQTNGQA